jgi:uncharacterized protein YndB with AHSA1/START domain
MTDIRITRDYPHPPAKVWRALTDPKLIGLWAMRPEGFAPVVGTRCRFVGKSGPGWRGFVECEVLEVNAPRTIMYSWVGNDGEAPTFVRYTLEARSGGTRLVFEHTGFKGVGGFFLAKFIMTPGWRKTFDERLPRVLTDVDERGELRETSRLEPLF